MASTKVIFNWKGIDKQGKQVSGEMTSKNTGLVKLELRKAGIKPKRVSKKSNFNIGFTLGERVKPADIALFTRQLATMIKAGVPLVQSFEIVADGIDNMAVKKIILQIRDDVSAGNTFANAVRVHKEHFDDLYCNLIDAGEQAGALETMLDRLASYKEKSEALKRKISSALKYPVAVLVIAGIVTGLLLVYVVPQFKEIFAGFGADLPQFTQVVVNMSEFMQAWWFASLLTLAGLIYAYRVLHKRFEGVRNGHDRLLLKLPIIGNLLVKSCIARFARTLSTTFAAGVPLVDALDSVSGAAGNVVYYDAIMKVREDVSGGIQLNYSMRKTGVFPNMVIQMVAIGEEAGALDDMLDKAASYYEDMVDKDVDGLTSLIEPLMMSFLGVVIGGLIVAMYLPIFSIGSAIGGS